MISAMANTAYAGKRERLIGAGIVAGVVGTAIIGREVRKSRKRAYRRGYEDAQYDRRVRRSRESRWERHVRRCYAAYRSYDERSDTYISYNGRERRCRK